MAKDAEIKVILNTKEAIQEAKDFGARLEKALNADIKTPDFTKLQDGLKTILKNAGVLTEELDAAGKAVYTLTKGFTTDGVKQYSDELSTVLTKCEQINEKIKENEAALENAKSSVAVLKGEKESPNQRSVKSLLGTYAGTKDAKDKANAKAAWESAKAQLKEQEALVVKLNTEQEQLNNTFDAEYAKIAPIVDEMETISSVSAKATLNVEEMETEYTAIQPKAEETATSTEQVADGAKEAADATKEISDAVNEASNAMDNLASKEQEATTPGDATEQNITQETKETTASLNDLMTAFLQAKSNLQDFRRAGEDTAETEQKIATVTDQIKSKLALTEATVASNNIAELVRHLHELATAQKLLEKSGIPAEFDSEYNRIVADIERTKVAINEYKKQVRDAAKPHKEVAQAATEMGETVKREVEQVVVAEEKAKKSGVNIGNGLKKGLSGLVSALRVVKKGLTSLSRTSDGVKSSFNGMSRDMRSNFRHMITSLTKYVLGFRSLFFLVRRLRKYIGEGIQNMARFNNAINPVNTNITKLLSSLLYLKNAWATAFSPILSFVTPWLTNLIDKLAEAGNAFSRFLGNLLGQSQVFQAVKVSAADYGKSLDTAGGSAGRAAKKQKQLNDRLAAFDDLIVLGVDKDPNGTGSGGGGGYDDQYTPDPNKMFKIVGVANDLLKKLKEMWANADFTELGEQIRDGIVNGLTNLEGKWGKIQETAYKIGKSFATFLNGVFKDPAIWQATGRAIGEMFNTVLAFVIGILKNNEVDWGARFADFLKSVLASVKPELLFSAAESFGKMLGEILASTLGNAELLGKLGEGLGNLIHAVLVAWGALLDQNDGNDVGKALYEFFKRLIQQINVSDLAKDLSGTLILVLDAISQFSEELAKDDTFQQALSDFIANINLDAIFEALGRNISSSIVAANAIGGAIADVLTQQKVAEKIGYGLGTLIANLDVGQMLASTIDFIAKLLGSAISDPNLPLKIGLAVLKALADNLANWIKENGAFEEAGGNVAEGIWEGIDNMLIALFDLAVSPFKLIWETFVDIFEIGSPSKLFESYGEWLIEGLLNGINNLIETVMTPFEDLETDLSEKWTAIKTTASEKWGEIKQKLYDKGTEIKSNLSKVWLDIRGDAYGAWVLLRVSAVEAFTQLKEALKKPINGIISIVESMINKLIGGMNNLFSKLNSLPDFKITNPFNGKEYNLSLNLPQLKNISIPRLAQGAVIPPNREFMAVLGDQSHGTNIEAPLDTIKQAVAEVLANNGNAEVIQLLQQLIAVVESKNLTIGDKEIGKANARYVNQQRMIRGASF